ncbi:MAG: UvrB/UvrC motif-containing protein [Fibrobacterota bacterium]
MNCDECKKKSAAVNFTQIINNKKTVLNLCRDCAEKRGFTGHVPGAAPQGGVGVGNLVSKIATEYEEESNAVLCDRCRLTYMEFKQTGRLGCGHCYEAFGKRLDDLLRKIHGSDCHIGKVPKSMEPAINACRQVDSMRREMQEAIRNEDFEKAARMRDKIKKMEG